MKFLGVHESQEFQQNQRFMEGTAMMESAVDNNQAVYRRREKAEHQVTSLDSNGGLTTKPDLNDGLKVKTIKYLLL